MTARKGLLARVAIDHAALLDFKDVNRTSINAHRTLTRVLQEFAVIECTGINDEIAIYEAVDQLSPDLQTYWTELLHGLYDSNRLRQAEYEETMRDMLEGGDLPPDVGARLDLVVVSDHVDQQRKLPPEGYTQRSGEPELSVAESVINSATMESVRALRARGNYPEGTSRQKIWSEVFAVLAELSIEATLLDGFFLEYALALERKPYYRDHARWLIKALDRALIPGSSLRMFCRLPRNVESGLAERALRELISPLIGKGNLSQVTVVLVPENAGRLPHNRHLRFSCGVAITSHEGFDRLGQDSISGVDGFNWDTVSMPDTLGQLGKRENVYLTRPDRVELHIHPVSAS